MATTDDRAALLALRARIDERFIATFRRNSFANRTWFLVAVAFVFAVHAAVLGIFLYRDWTAPPQAAKEEATPVEVVMQQPPPPPPQPQQQKPKQEIEKPATSAPRAESDTQIETDKTDKETRAPKAETPPTDGDPQPTKDAAQTTKDTSTDADAEAAAENPDVQTDAEALDKAAPKPPQDKPKSARAKVAAKPKRATSPLQQLAGLSGLPDYHFAKRTKKSPISGGDEDSRYLAIVYGLISSHIHFGGGEGAVTITFELGNDGEVLDIGLLSSSGDQMADAEVINAVRRSSPFPPPPPDRPHSLRATIDFSRHPMSMGAR